MKQTLHVQALLQAAHPGFTFDIQTSIASGDLELTKPLHELAAANRGLFTKELEVRLRRSTHGLWLHYFISYAGVAQIGLLSGAYDIAVHSLKDMPTTLPSGLTLAAITQVLRSYTYPCAATCELSTCCRTARVTRRRAACKRKTQRHWIIGCFAVWFCYRNILYSADGPPEAVGRVPSLLLLRFQVIAPAYRTAFVQM